MGNLIIADLEQSIELDREAMRAIIGLGTRGFWPRQTNALFLLHTSKRGTGQRAAANRWSEFLRSQSLMPFRHPGRARAIGSQ